VWPLVVSTGGLRYELAFSGRLRDVKLGYRFSKDLYFPQFSAMVSVLFELAACGYGLASLREGESRGSAGGCCCDSPGDLTFRLAICTDTPLDCRL
jgi:hypothetical protein